MLKKIGLFFHLALLATIAGLLLFDYRQIASLLMQINMIVVIFNLLLTANKETKILSKGLFSLIILLVILISILYINYQESVYVGFVSLALYLIAQVATKNLTAFKEMLCIIALPFSIIALSAVTTSSFAFGELAWNAWDAMFIVLAIWSIAKHDSMWLAQLAPKFVISMLFIYTPLIMQIPVQKYRMLHLVQAEKITILNFITLNTSQFIDAYHLAIYCALMLIIAIYYFFLVNRLLKLILIIIIFTLSYYVLMTSWRPIWLGLAISSLFLFVLFDKRQRLLLIAAMLLLQVMLFTTNVGNYGGRLIELAKNINTEERNYIWRDAWKMQMHSPVKNWIIGHGIDSFKNDFKPYSNYITPGITFESPHNVVLEVLYSSGLLGLFFVTCFYYFLVTYLFKIARFDQKNKILACVLLILLTTTQIINGLNFQFLMRYNVFPLAFICGTLLYVKESRNNVNRLV